MAAPFPGYLNCSSLGLSSWVFGLGRGTAVPLEILGRGTSGCGPRALKAAGALGEGMGHIRQSVPIRILPDHLANGVGSREAARVVRCRVRTGAPDGRAPGKMRSGVQPTSGGQPRSPSEVVERDWWAARILGVRSRRRRQLGGRAARRERGGRPPNLAWSWPGVRTLLFWLRARACDRFPVR